MQKRTHTAGGKNPATSRILGPDGVLLRSHAEFWSRQTVCKVLWTTVSPDCDTCLQTDPWHFLDDLWWTVVGVHTLYQFTTKVTYSFFLHSVTVPGILRIDSLTFQTSVFILHLPEKQLCGSSPIHFFFFFSSQFAPFGCISLEDCAVLQVFIKWAGWGSVSGSLCVDFTFSSQACMFFVLCNTHFVPQTNKL